MCFPTGSSSESFPSSASIWTATPVTGLVMDAIQKTASACIGFSPAMSARPTVSTWRTSSREATSVTAPAISFSATNRAMRSATGEPGSEMAGAERTAAEMISTQDSGFRSVLMGPPCPGLCTTRARGRRHRVCRPGGAGNTPLL
jgi:hypothetical protein